MEYKISIEGDYWDSFIYRGRLYLWTMNCSLICIDWEKLIRFYSKKMKYDLFSSYLTWIDGNYLYKQNLNYLFQDSDFKQYLINKLNKTSFWEKNSFTFFYNIFFYLVIFNLKFKTRNLSNTLMFCIINILNQFHLGRYK